MWMEVGVRPRGALKCCAGFLPIHYETDVSVAVVELEFVKAVRGFGGTLEVPLEEAYSGTAEISF
jgi:hypothetical protein